MPPIAAVWVSPDRLEDRLDTRPYKPWVLAGTDACRRFPGGTAQLDSRTLASLSRGAGGGSESPGPIAVYKAKEVTGRGLAAAEIFLNQCPDEKLLRTGDVLLTSSGIGTIGRADMYYAGHPGSAAGATVDNHVAIIRCKPSLLLPEYLVAFLNSSYGRAWSEWGTTGSTRLLELSPSRVRRFQVPRADKEIQRFIGARIELANRCRATAHKHRNDASLCLERAMGTSLASNTFCVDSGTAVSADGYEVVANRPIIVRAASPRIQGYLGPQFFHPRREKALLVIENSRVRTRRLADLAERFASRMGPEEVRRDRLAYVGLAQIDSEQGVISEHGDEEPSGSSAYFEAGHLLFSKLRPYLNKIAICPSHLSRAAGSTELLTYRVRQDAAPYYLLFVLRSQLVLNQVRDITSGLTHPRIDPELVDDVLIPLVDEKDMEAIAAATRSALHATYRANALVEEAKSYVEALIEGTLDTKAILSGKLKPPTEEEVLGEQAGVA